MYRDKFLQQNQLDALISQIYFWNKTLHVSDSSSVHHQEFFTVHTTMVYVLRACVQDQDGTSSVLILFPSCQQTCMTYTVAVCSVNTPDDEQRNCPKHVDLFQK